MRRSFGQIMTIGVLGTLSTIALGFAPQGGIALKLPTVSQFKNWGLAGATNQASIHAVDAWIIEKGNHAITVAIIDTGVDSNHPLIKKNLWHDPLHPTQYGWNFVNNSPNPNDEHGHGTHVAGIVGANSDTNLGISGVAPNISIMAVKYYNDNATGAVNLKNTVQAVNYAVEHGARIINYSGGGPEFSEEEYLAIKKAEAKGILFVSAAGNEHQDTDRSENYYYPSAYRLSNILSVAAIDMNNNLLKSSNWGKRRVDVAAPGENIFSTLPNNKAGYMTGTSQATAFVSGVAALLLSKDPTLTPVQLKEIIMSSVDRFPQLSDKLATGGRINAYAALMAMKSRGKFPPEKTALPLRMAKAEKSEDLFSLATLLR